MTQLIWTQPCRKQLWDIQDNLDEGRTPGFLVFKISCLQQDKIGHVIQSLMWVSSYQAQM